MIKTIDVVKTLFLRSDTAQLAAHEGLLNVSAFARSIQAATSDMAKKPVEVGTITTALYRLMDQYSFKNFKPKVSLNQLTLHAQVIAITFERNSTITERLPLVLVQLGQESGSFYTVTQGPDEITLIADQSLEKTITQKLGVPKKIFKELVAINVRFDEKYLNIPNMIYTILASFAIKQINILEIVSTYTSLTFVVNEAEMTRSLAALKVHLGK